MKDKKINIIAWLLPFLGIILLALVMFKRAPETFEDDNIYYSDIEDVDESLIAYKEIPGIAFELDELNGLALDSKDNIFVVGGKKLLILNPDGAVLKEIKLSAPGYCVTVADNGDIYIGFKDHIEIYDFKGEKLSTWKTIDDNSYITALTLAGGFLFVADAGKRKVWKFNLNGNLEGNIGGENKKNGVPKLIVPSPYFDLATAKDGRSIWLVNPGRHKLENFSLDGKLKSIWGEYSPDMEGFCGCCNPTNFALLKDGSFVTSEKGYVRIKIYDPKGNFHSIVATPNQFTERTKGLDLAVDSKERIMVLDPMRRKIRIFVKNMGMIKPSSQLGKTIERS